MNDQYNAIISDVLVQIRPDGELESSIRSTIEQLTKRVEDRVRDLDLNITIKHVGSTAKGTHLRSGDIDLFIGFDPSVAVQTLERTILELGKDVLPDHLIKYADHPYVRGTLNGHEVDLVPCYAIPPGTPIISPVDRTPFHTEYVISRLRPDQCDDVRLLKQFLKGIGCYGAENRTMGFSGYLTELFIIRYGSFEECLKAVSSWEQRTFIDIEGTGYTGPDEKRSLIIVDPVDPTRNVSSPVSRKNIGMFIHAARIFLSDPTRNFFFPQARPPLPREKIEAAIASRGEIIVITFEPPEVIDDILYPQIRMTMERLTTLLEDQGFKLNDSGSLVDAGGEEEEEKVYLYFDLRISHLPEFTLHRGPQVYNAKHEERFLEKWNDSHPFLIDDRWHVLAPVKFRTARELLAAKLPDFQTGRHIMASLDQGFELLGPDDVPANVISHFLDRRMPWE